MKCLRCGSPMYRVQGKDGSKATCAGCSQYVDCAQCSSATCGDTKCLRCYNKALLPGQPGRLTPGSLVSDESEF
jgi:ssDNA-binding Zn-finger/Zn-ribbon topoisomerase 1